MAKKFHFLLEPAFLFEQDIGRDRFQARGYRERHRVGNPEFKSAQFGLPRIATDTAVRLLDCLLGRQNPG
ncbi:MAG TPA: hypothetical protein VN065_20905 [Bradyrhizobium sp.]|nr:hypothetical protein [Bradyrhizobium sp.]